MSRAARTFVWLSFSAAVVVVVGTCAHGVGRQGDDGGGVQRDAAIPGVDGAVQFDASIVIDGGQNPDGGTECTPDPLPETVGAQCTAPIGLGALNDFAADVTTVTGNGTPAGRELWWSFVAMDDADTAGDEFHVDVRFLVNPNQAYEMDVYRGSCNAVDRLAVGEKDSFDWYVDQPSTSTGCTTTAPCGEGDCVPNPDTEGINTCNDDTATFFVAVRRTDGAESCDGFVLELSNGLYVAP
ncbi:MAG: hypothetical protein ABI333_16730 [bacterium]